MKIGILTYYGDLNCGTNLQAYATLQIIKEVYPNDKVEIIPFHGFRPQVRPYKSFSVFSVLRDIKRIYKYQLFKRKDLGITEKDIIIKDVKKALCYISNRGYDIIYIGADTLLELDRLSKSNEGLSAYWLTNVKAKKILIAASAKNVEYEKLSSHQRNEMEIAISQFDSIGIRDESTRKLLSHFVDSHCINYIPDPTFTLDIDYSYIETYLKNKNVEISSRSVLIHCYGDDKWVEEVAAVLRKENYQVVSLRPSYWADLSLNDMSPFEQLGIYRYFEFVITHRFHDGVFCLKNGTPFMLYEKGIGHSTVTGESKFTSLLKDFGLYPDNFIGRGDEVTASLIIEKRQNAIEKFRDKDVIIKEMLLLKKDVYLNFLKETI